MIQEIANAQEILEIANQENLLVLMPFGSHLYGTNTPDSDYDYKGVFMPTKQEVVLGRIRPRVAVRPNKAEGEKNEPGDIDFELFSLHEFIRLALEGQTVAIDMLHASHSLMSFHSPLWQELVENRKRFYTKNLKAFVGYARRQAAKYGIKGSRLACAKAWFSTLQEFRSSKVSHFVEMLDIGELKPLTKDHWEHARLTGVPEAPLEILGKRLTDGAFMDHYVPMMQKYVDSYGERARQAMKNEGVDWKALSHAIRAAMEVETILVGGDLVLPFGFQRAEHLKAIKLGQLPFSVVQEELEERIERLEDLAESSTLPESPDIEWAENFLAYSVELSLFP